MGGQEFEQAIRDVEDQLEASKKGFRKGWESLRGAEKSYKNLEQLRNKALQDILKEKGLVVCSRSHYEWEGKKKPTQEELGVYPRREMRLYFHKSFRHESESEGHVYRSGGTISVLLLCPEHFPENPNSIFGDEGFTRLDDGQVTSEILQENGKFVLAVNRWDVTKLIKNGRRGISNIEKFERNGGTYPNQVIYKYFGIPDLPEEPKYDTVR